MTKLFSGNRRLFLALLVALLAALMMFGACGGDDDDLGGADEPEATEQEDDSDSEDEDEDSEDEDADSTPEDEDEDEPTPQQDDEDEGDDDSGGGEDVCALITAEEIEEITGLDVGEGENQDFDPFYSCNFATETFDTVQVDLYHASEDEVEFYFELTQDAEEIDGIGDRAQFGGLLNQLEVLEGEYDITIWISSTGTIEDDEALEMSKEIAQIVLDGLP